MVTSRYLMYDFLLISTFRRLPIYLDYPYKDAELKAKLLPNFKAIGPLGDTSVSMSIIARKVKEQTRMSPFAKLHIRYSSKAEERIVQDHNVQIYKRYGTSILRTFDRIRLTQMSIESPKVAIKGNKGAGLDLKKLQFDGILLASYPVSYNETISESRVLYAIFLDILFNVLGTDGRPIV